MQKKNAEQILKREIELLTHYLTELSDVRDTSKDQFAYGEKTAYTECLELLFQWDKAESHGLTFELNKIFPL